MLPKNRVSQILLVRHGMLAPRTIMKSPVVWVVNDPKASLRSITRSPLTPPTTSAERVEILPRNMKRTPSEDPFSMNWLFSMPPVPS